MVGSTTQQVHSADQEDQEDRADGRRTGGFQCRLGPATLQEERPWMDAYETSSYINYTYMHLVVDTCFVCRDRK